MVLRRINPITTTQKSSIYEKVDICQDCNTQYGTGSVLESGVLHGSVHDAYAIKTYPKATILHYKTPSDIVLANMFVLKKNIAINKEVRVSKKTGEIPSFFAGIANSMQSNIVQENRYLLILEGLKTTVIISVLSTFFGTVLGAIVCFMRMSKNAILNVLAKTYISILRGTPVLVFLMLIFYVVFASVNIDPYENGKKRQDRGVAHAVGAKSRNRQ